MEKNIVYLLLISALLFLLSFPLIGQIDFIQNDDWVYYRMIENFLSGNFKLEPESGATFYSQGFMAIPFVRMFGLSNLPVLTLFISVISFFIFGLILIKKFQLNIVLSLLLSLLFFFNPLHIYGGLGFMTENYYVFFMLLSFYFLFSFLEDYKNRDFTLLNIFIFLGFLVRQISITTGLALFLYLIYKKQYRRALYELLIVGGMLLFYFVIFPRTEIMMGKRSLHFGESLFNIRYLFTMTYVILLYLCAFALPFFVLVINNLFFNKLNKIRLRNFGFVAVLFTLLPLLIGGAYIAYESFPYLENTFERWGFFSHTIRGYKYNFFAYNNFFDLWGFVSRAFLASTIVCVVAYQCKKFINFPIIFIFTTIAVLLTSQNIFDRYLVGLIPAAILFFVLMFKKQLDNRIFIYSLVGFTAGLIFLGYQFTYDYILVQNYVWNRSEELAMVSEVEPSNIVGNYAWRKLNPTSEKNFFFTYDDPKFMKNVEPDFELIEGHEVTYPMSIFIEPKIYLYGKVE